MSDSSADEFKPVHTFFPGRSRRWAAENCRAGRLPGAVRVGREWLIRRRDVDAFVSSKGGAGK